MVATEYALLELRKDLGILFFRWKNTTTPEQIKDGYNLLLNSPDLNKVNCWLIDTRRRGPANAANETWFFDEYLPELNKRLTREHSIAVLTTPDHFEHIREKIGFEKIEEYTKGTKVIMKFFNAEQEAVGWLQVQQQA